MVPNNLRLWSLFQGRIVLLGFSILGVMWSLGMSELWPVYDKNGPFYMGLKLHRRYLGVLMYISANPSGEYERDMLSDFENGGCQFGYLYFLMYVCRHKLRIRYIRRHRKILLFLINRGLFWIKYRKYLMISFEERQWNSSINASKSAPPRPLHRIGMTVCIVYANT